MAEFNATILIFHIDQYLTELGTQSLFDGDKVRDMLFDLRLLCMTMDAVDPPPVSVVADPALFTEIIAPL